MALALDEQEQRWLDGHDGAAMQLAMRLVLAAAEVSGATSFVPIESAHINSCHYSGSLSLDFAEFLLAEGAVLSVPTHTNASLISCDLPTLRPEAATPTEVAGARRLMEIYEALGCSSMWTCAPYQQPEGRPPFGAHVVGSESNAVGFTNSVLGARTNKYGDLLDISAALVGRVPFVGLHTDEGRRATHRFDVSGLSDVWFDDPNLPHLLGVVVGKAVGAGIGVIDGWPSAGEDELKALVAAGAAAGGVDLVHVVGITPEAPTLEAASGGVPVARTTVVGPEDLAAAAAELTTAAGDEPLRAVCLGTPHFSIDELAELVDRLDGRRLAEGVTMLVTTSRAVAAEAALRGLDDRLAASGGSLVLDTCTYYPPRSTGIDGFTLTNSAKWAYYGRGMLDVPIAFTSLERCVESAVAGRWV